MEKQTVKYAIRGALAVAALTLAGVMAGCYCYPRPTTVVRNPAPPPHQPPPAQPPPSGPVIIIDSAPTPPAYGPGRVWYYGYHPHIPHYSGGHRFCYIEGSHSHEYEPYRTHLYVWHDGYYFWVGNPRPYGYRHGMYAFYGHHPHAHYFGGWCYVNGHHHHHYRPRHHNHYRRRSGTYYYTGRYNRHYHDHRNSYDRHGRHRTSHRDGYRDHARGGRGSGRESGRDPAGSGRGRGRGEGRATNPDDNKRDDRGKPRFDTAPRGDRDSGTRGGGSRFDDPSRPAVTPAPRATPAPRVQPATRATPAPRVQPAPRTTPAPRVQPAPRATVKPGVQPAPRATPKPRLKPGKDDKKDKKDKKDPKKDDKRDATRGKRDQ